MKPFFCGTALSSTLSSPTENCIAKLYRKIVLKYIGTKIVLKSIGIKIVLKCIGTKIVLKFVLKCYNIKLY